MQRSRTILALLAVAWLVSGCVDYMNRWDSVTFRAGDAVDADKGIQTVDPFPREAWHTHINSDGKVIYKAVTDYQSGRTSTDTGLSSGAGQTITPTVK